jgi:hypothetical protein
MMRSPWISTTWFANIWPDFGSNNLPARITVVCAACDQSMAAAPSIPVTVLNTYFNRMA